MMTVGANSTEAYEDDIFSEYPSALVKCLAMMSLGYLSGRFRLLSTSDAEGINKFTSYWALPSLLYLTIATHEPSVIRWRLISAILVGKIIIFVTVIAFCVIIKLQRRFTAACFYATFNTVTNDAGLGNVVVQALCAKECSDLPVHLFYIQPISTILIYSLAFTVMKTGDVDSIGRVRLFKHSFQAIWTTAKNPLILAFTLGLITRACLPPPLPYYLRYVLNIIISAFPANILFLLGTYMVGKFQVLSDVRCSNYVSWIPSTSFFIKMIATPVLLHAVVINFPNAEKKDGDFAFLYGTMAPSTQILSFAKQYGFPIDPIASTLALTNLAFLPLSYLTAKAAFDNLTEFNDILRTILFYVSVASFVCGLLTNVFLYCKRKKLHSSATIIMWLVVCQMALAMGAILVFSFNRRTMNANINQVLVFGGQVTCHIWTANLTVFLYLKHRYKVKKLAYLLLTGFGIPALLTACVLICSSFLPSDKLPFVLAYDKKWLIVNTVATGCSLVVTIVFLSLHFRNRNLQVVTDHCRSNPEPNVYAIPIDEDALAVSSHLGNERRHAGSVECNTNTCNQQQSENQNKHSLPCFLRFSEDLFGLLIILCVLMIQTFTAQLFKLTSDGYSGILIAIEFVSSAGNFGQGIVTFFWFGINVRWATTLVKRRWIATTEFFSTRIIRSFRRRFRRIHISS